VTSDPIDQRVLTRIDRIPLGMLYMTGATLMFAVSSALSKWQVSIYSFDEVLFMRAITSLAICGVLILPRTALPCSAPSGCATTSAAAPPSRWRKA